MKVPNNIFNILEKEKEGSSQVPLIVPRPPGWRAAWPLFPNNLAKFKKNLQFISLLRSMHRQLWQCQWVRMSEKAFCQQTKVDLWITLLIKTNFESFGILAYCFFQHPAAILPSIVKAVTHLRVSLPAVVDYKLR